MVWTAGNQERMLGCCMWSYRIIYARLGLGKKWEFELEV